MNMIKKPFRFLKNLMRWYEKESDNNLREIRTEVIENELWKKAEENFNKRGLPIPMYENHDKDSVVGQVYKIEARDDGLYVTEHQLTDKGLELVKNGEYPLPSGDFVLHYDDNGNIIDLEVIGVSLVNSEGAKDVELVTMNKYGEKFPIYKIKIKQNKGDVKMEKEEIFEMLLDDDFIKELPEEVCKKIIEIRTKKPEEEPEEDIEKASMNNDEEEKKQNKEEEEKKETASQNKDEDKRKLIDEVAGLMKSAGASDEIIQTAIKKMEEMAYDKEEAEMNSEEEENKEKKEEDKKMEIETQNKEEEEDKKESTAMSKFADMIASHEAKTGSKVVPSSVKPAVNFLKRNVKYMGKRAIDVAFKELAFYGGRKIEQASMGKEKDRSIGDITKDLLKY